MFRQCKSFQHPLDHRAVLRECSGTTLRLAAACLRDSRTPGCTYATVVLLAFDHNTVRRWQALRGGQGVYLERLAVEIQQCNHHTMLAHRLPVGPCQFWPQLSNALIELLNLRFSQDGTWRLVL